MICLQNVLVYCTACLLLRLRIPWLPLCQSGFGNVFRDSLTVLRIINCLFGVLVFPSHCIHLPSFHSLSLFWVQNISISLSLSPSHALINLSHSSKLERKKIWQKWRKIISKKLPTEGHPQERRQKRKKKYIDIWHCERSYIENVSGMPNPHFVMWGTGNW